VLDTGEIREPYRSQYHLPFLAQAATQLAALTGMDATQTRLIAQSMVHLSVRYALTAPVELAFIVGLDDQENRGEAAQRAVESHLVQVAYRLMNIDVDPTRNKD